jgi:dCTP diphosphatase
MMDKGSLNNSGEKAGEGTALTLLEAQGRMREFVREREWEQFHTPRNLLLALVGEVGEVAELFQWKGEVATGLPSFTA